jgi:cytochrome P450
MRPALGSGLATSEGALWRRQRRLIQPPFTHSSVLGLGNQITEALDSALSDWHRTVSARRVIAINREMAHLSLTILLRTIFGSDIGANARPILDATMEVGSFLNRRLAAFVDIPLVVPTPANRRFNKALQGFDSSIADPVQTRRSRHDASTDLLGALLSAGDSETGMEMSNRQIRDEVFTILLAGHETVALGLTWAWYLLAHHPHVEAMRLYPPIWAVPRAALADDEIAGYHIPAGSLVFPSQYLAHRHPDFWESPATFDPERFAPDRDDRARHAYFPFGEGARSCMGVHFAIVEMCLPPFTRRLQRRQSARRRERGQQHRFGLQDQSRRVAAHRQSGRVWWHPPNQPHAGRRSAVCDERRLQLDRRLPARRQTWADANRGFDSAAGRGHERAVADPI